MFHPVAQTLEHQAGIVSESIGRLAIDPAARFFQRLGVIPVVKRDKGCDVGLEQAVDQSIVEGQACLVDLAPTGGHHPGPAYAQSIGSEIQRLHQFHIDSPSVIVVASHVARFAGEYLPLRMGKPIPDTFAFAIGIPGAFNLIRCRRRAPQKILGEDIAQEHLKRKVIRAHNLMRERPLQRGRWL